MLKRSGAIFVALASLSFLASPSAAETKLVKAVSDHFELYTTDNETAAKDALAHFESVRAYLLSSIHSEDPFAQPVRLVAFKSGGEFTPYIPRNGDLAARAFSETAAGRTTIVLSSCKKEAYEYGVREYAMLLFAKTAPKMPFWLRYGFSQFYGSLHMDNGQMVMGSPPARDFRGSISFDFDMGVMFRLNGGITQDKGSADFYSENPSSRVTGSSSSSSSSSSTLPSQVERGAAMANMESTTTVDYPDILWTLTHMLMFQKPYSQKFGAFVGAVAGGQDTPAAVEQVLGESLSALKQDLVLYLKLPAHATIRRPFQLEKPLAPQVSQLSGAESALVLAELKAAR
ncbi:MAG TPA: hypothetical protein VMU19_00515 [Bryobacteraceae bacterium]|nr:hypothetical protein [Bryobacteraceae bacterium]